MSSATQLVHGPQSIDFRTHAILQIFCALCASRLQAGDLNSATQLARMAVQAADTLIVELDKQGKFPR